MTELGLNKILTLENVYNNAKVLIQHVRIIPDYNINPVWSCGSLENESKAVRTLLKSSISGSVPISLRVSVAHRLGGSNGIIPKSHVTKALEC